jgi:hypothetical protein
MSLQWLVLVVVLLLHRRPGLLVSAKVPVEVVAVPPIEQAKGRTGSVRRIGGGQ